MRQFDNSITPTYRPAPEMNTNELDRVGVSLPKHQIDKLDWLADTFGISRSHALEAVILSHSYATNDDYERISTMLDHTTR